MSNLEHWQRSHWKKRWGREKLDHYMGGRGITPVNRAAAHVVIDLLKAKSVVDIGGGTFRFLKFCRSLDNSIRCAATEIDLPAVRKYAIPEIDIHYSMIPYPLPWPDKSFDVAYQNNTLANMQSRHVPGVVAEMARVASIIVFANGCGSRFWEGRKPITAGKLKEWMLGILSNNAELISTHEFGITVWKTKPVSELIPITQSNPVPPI